MIELGKVQTLTVQRVEGVRRIFGRGGSFRSLRSASEETGSGGAKPGDEISVFIYKDSEDRLIATTGIPSFQ